MVPLKNSWEFPVIEAAHVTGVALLAGTAIFADLRRLGWAVVRQTSQELDRVFRPWAHAGLAILLATGALMTFADWERYRRNPAFWTKLAFVVLALLFYFSPRKSRAAVFASLLCWSAVVLAARAIADFDI
jgi:uncharacterized membrane protein